MTIVPDPPGSRRPSFSLRMLLAAVTLAGLGCAALVNATPLVAGVAFSTVLICLFIATLLAVYGCRPRRAFRVGVSVVGWGYLAIAYWPGGEPVVSQIRDHLLTTQLIEWGHERYTTVAEDAVEVDVSVEGELTDDPTVALDETAADSVDPFAEDVEAWAPDATSFLTVGHALSAAVLALLGGALAQWLDSRRPPLDQPASTP